MFFYKVGAIGIRLGLSERVDELFESALICYLTCHLFKKPTKAYLFELVKIIKKRRNSENINEINI
jgi:hypothetical protein